MTETVLPIKINYLQRLMWRWSQYIAYNAVHVIHVEGKADIARWEQATLITLQEVGLGFPQLGLKGEIYFLPLTTLSVPTLTVPLENHINHEFNRSFAIEEFPLRFFIIPRDDGTYYFSVTYNHWVADAYAIRILLQRIVSCYRGDVQRFPAPTLQAPSFKSLFRQHLGKFPSLLWLSEMVHSLKLFYNAHRLTLNNPLDFRSQYELQTVSTETLRKLKLYCNQQNISMNDLFIAVLAQIMGQFTAKERQQKKSRRIFGKRNRIAISTIADIRYAANQPLNQVIGQYLSSYTLVLSSPEQRPMNVIAQEVNHYTSQIKKSAHIVRSHYNFASALWLWDCNRSPKRRAVLFHKYAPICAGISNVHVQDDWLSKESHQSELKVVDYWRVSPTGPLAPLVFSISTFREKLTVCLAYRCSALTKLAAATLCQRFCQELAFLVQ